MRSVAHVVAFDARNDVAVLRVPGLRGRALGVADFDRGQPGALLGYPENGPLQVTPVRLGQHRQGRYTRRIRAGWSSAGRSSRCAATCGAGTRAGRSWTRTGASSRPCSRSAEARTDGFAVPNDRVGAALENVGPALETACVAR